MDCLILAGNRKNYLEVSHENKAFLPIDDRSILQIMLDELSTVEEIDRFLIVGPKQRLQEHLAARLAEEDGKPIRIIEQRDDLVGNILEAYDAGADRGGHDRPVFILPSDTPLLIAEEVREFLGMCDMDRYDYVGGVTSEAVLQRFYPTDNQPGIRLAYFFCEGMGYRINNMHMVRPYSIGRMNNIRKVYSMRYQKRFSNAMGVAWVLLKQAISSPGAVFFYLGLNTVYWLQLLRLNKLAMSVSRIFKLKRLSHYISKALDTRMKIVTNSYGGSTLDVDNDHDYEVIREQFQNWWQMQKQLKPPRESN